MAKTKWVACGYSIEVVTQFQEPTTIRLFKMGGAEYPTYMTVEETGTLVDALEAAIRRVEETR